MSQHFGLYIHIPICVAKCPYCDFVSYPLNALGSAEHEAIITSLIRELDLALETYPNLRGRCLHSIYFGGGTPSLLPADVIAGLIARAGEVFVPRSEIEVTLECNPVSAEVERLESYRKAGVNRVSLGVQSLNDKILRTLGRRHSAEEALQAIQRIKTLGFPSWGFDLIFGVPGLSPNLWHADVEKAIGLNPPHLSVYGLTLHEGTLMFEQHTRGEFELPDEETQRDMFLEARHMLLDAGWRHYEISNYARPGHESCHNSIYWTGGEYLGVGVSAHSYIGNKRMANPASLSEYLSLVEHGQYPAVQEPLPDLRSQRAERIMLALRQLDGFSPTDLGRSLGCNLFNEYQAELETLSEQGLLQVSPQNIRLTEEGLLLSDLVFEAFF